MFKNTKLVVAQIGVLALSLISAGLNLIIQREQLKKYAEESKDEEEK